MTKQSRVALVTGASGSIGRAVARRLAQQGHRLVLVDVVREPLRALCDAIEGAMGLLADFEDADSVRRCAAEAEALTGGIDILVNNAGILSSTKITDTDLAEWRRVQAINVEAPLLLTAAVLPGMRQRQFGRIVNMASYAAKSGGLTAGTAYSVSKSAMVGLTFATARETAGDGITVNAIAPAYVISPMVLEQLTEAQRAAQLKQIPVGRFCEPEEVAHTVSFLVSPLAGFITGEVIDMNGGLQFD